MTSSGCGQPPWNRQTGRRSPAHPGCQISSFPKSASVADGGDQSGRCHRADSGDGRESLASLILGRYSLDDCIHLFDPCGKLIELQLELR